MVSLSILGCTKNTDAYNADGKNPIDIGDIYVKGITADELTRSTNPHVFRDGDVLTVTATAGNIEDRSYSSNYIFHHHENKWFHDGASDIFSLEQISSDYSLRLEINKGRWTNVQNDSIALHQSDYIAGPGEIRDGVLCSAALVPLTHQYIYVEVTIEEGDGWQRAGGFTAWMERSTVKIFHPGATDIILPNATFSNGKITYTAVLKPGSVPRPNGYDVLLSLDPNVAGESILHLRYNTLMGVNVKPGQQISLSVPYNYENGMKNGWAKISDWKVR